jgi:hypothetical protein
MNLDLTQGWGWSQFGRRDRNSGTLGILRYNPSTVPVLDCFCDCGFSLIRQAVVLFCISVSAQLRDIKGTVQTEKRWFETGTYQLNCLNFMPNRQSVFSSVAVADPFLLRKSRIRQIRIQSRFKIQFRGFWAFCSETEKYLMSIVLIIFR